jgi:hypothetical protein
MRYRTGSRAKASSKCIIVDGHLRESSAVADKAAAAAHVHQRVSRAHTAASSASTGLTCNLTAARHAELPVVLAIIPHQSHV